MNIEILDCTLRDGGYYCDWDFENSVVERYATAVSAAGIHYVEAGFRSKAPRGFAGRYWFCSENTLRKLFGATATRLAVMINGKDFIHQAGEIDRQSLRSLFVPKCESAVDLVRITTTIGTFEPVLTIAEELRERGYMVAVNIMRASMVSMDELAWAAELAEAAPVDILYLADSFGGMTPEATRQACVSIKTHFSRQTGFHAHDNLGLALANSLMAIEGGAGTIDCSLLGMGRGAGNLRTEQLLLYLRSKMGLCQFDPTPLFDVVTTEFARLHQQHQWGASLPYMLAGVHDVHPTYPQELLQLHRYSSLEVVRILESLRDSGDGTTFNHERLTTAVRKRFTQARNAVPIVTLPGYRAGLPPATEPGRPVLIVGSGPSVHERADDINEFIRLQRPLVIECNVQAGIHASPSHVSVFINHLRLSEHARALGETGRRAVVGLAEVGAELTEALGAIELYHSPYRVDEGRFAFEDDVCVIPHDVVSMFAFGLAIRAGATSIFVCGFDGYLRSIGSADHVHSGDILTMDREMRSFFQLLSQYRATAPGLSVVSLTPTAYDIEQGSLYAYL